MAVDQKRNCCSSSPAGGVEGGVEVEITSITCQAMIMSPIKFQSADRRNSAIAPPRHVEAPDNPTAVTESRPCLQITLGSCYMFC